ncbi:pyridoxamine 5'-phosphate oxidase family protein [Fructilactobacillus frigidiflavus]|uniref:pyridoxamine 5'-phosphate oxidase family protein n=1 Tax=Fructilactobacillus frigidiflavus TaxID=3242688 RepID=UPI0037565175
MYLKRFIELFIAYAISFLLAILAIGYPFNFAHLALISSGVIVGYLVLVIPLTLLTIKKMTTRKKASGVNQHESKFANVLNSLPAFMYLATKNKDGIISNSIITYAQSSKQENVFYVVTPATTERAKNIQQNHQVAIASLFEQKTGLRFSSNQATAKAITESEKIEKLASEIPQIKQLDENLKDKAVIIITLNSAIIESFRDRPEIIKF